jgi:hypothetical protein
VNRVCERCNAVSREALLNEVWVDYYGTPPQAQSIDREAAAKTKDVPASLGIFTVHTLGYRLEV